MLRRSLWWLVCALLWVGCAGTQPAGHPPAVAAPAAAAPTDAAIAARWRDALDGEGLFTVAGGLKPVSCGFWSTWLDAVRPDADAVAAVRAELAPLCDDELWADVLVFHQVHNGRRAAQAYVADRPALARLLREQAAFFAPRGLFPDTHPAEVFAVVERLPEDDRHRGMGLLFGYPQHAIDFFIAAQRQDTSDGKPAPRRFVQIPTFGAAEGRFVYAVPPDHVEQDADRQLRARAAAILARYRELRAAAAPGDLGAWRRLVRTLRAEFVGGAEPGIEVGLLEPCPAGRGVSACPGQFRRPSDPW